MQLIIETSIKFSVNNVFSRMFNFLKQYLHLDLAHSNILSCFVLYLVAFFSPICECMCNIYILCYQPNRKNNVSMLSNCRLCSIYIYNNVRVLELISDVKKCILRVLLQSIRTCRTTLF